MLNALKTPEQNFYVCLLDGSRCASCPRPGQIVTRAQSHLRVSRRARPAGITLPTNQGGVLIKRIRNWYGPNFNNNNDNCHTLEIASYTKHEIDFSVLIHIFLPFSDFEGLRN